MSLFKKTNNKNNKSKLPSKKTMNLYQPDIKNDPKTIITVTAAVIVLITLVLGKFFILDKVNQLYAYKNETAAMETEYYEMFQKYAGYDDLKEKYYRYSENYSKDETKLIDRITVTTMLKNVTEDLASITATSINGNSVSITVITSDLEKLAQFRSKLENVDFVHDVVVYSAARDTGDVTSSVAFKCTVGEDYE